mgnify:CR=1 FL=1
MKSKKGIYILFLLKIFFNPPLANFSILSLNNLKPINVNVDENNLPCRYLLHFEDEFGNRISDECTIVAQYKNTDVKDLKGLQDEIINIFERYTKNQRKNDRDKLYLCFFYEKNFDKKTIKDSNKDVIKDPKGMLFINASKGIDIKKVLEKLIKIDTEIYLSQSDKDFRFAYDGKDILCVVNIKYKNILENAVK